MGYTMQTHFTRHFTRPLRALLAAALCAPSLSFASTGTDLETLFYTPAQRQDISRGRQGLAGTNNATATRLNGVVRRAGGKGTIWINGEPFAEGSPQVGQIKGVDAVVEGRRLRVGEAIDKASGARTDVVTPGSVTVRSKP